MAKKGAASSSSKNKKSPSSPGGDIIVADEPGSPQLDDQLDDLQLAQTDDDGGENGTVQLKVSPKVEAAAGQI